VCGPEGIENGYEGVVVPDDECELLRGGRLGDSILPRASLKASLCCCCCCVTLCAAALESCSGYPRDLGGWDSEGFVFTSVGITNKSNYLGFVEVFEIRVRQTSKTFKVKRLEHGHVAVGSQRNKA